MLNFLNCNKCGCFMSKDGDEWQERESMYEPPLSPYVKQDWKCGCGNTRITSYDVRYPIHVMELQSSAPIAKEAEE